MGASQSQPQPKQRRTAPKPRRQPVPTAAPVPMAQPLPMAEAVEPESLELDEDDVPLPPTSEQQYDIILDYIMDGNPSKIKSDDRLSTYPNQDFWTYCIQSSTENRPFVKVVSKLLQDNSLVQAVYSRFSDIRPLEAYATSTGLYPSGATLPINVMSNSLIRCAIDQGDDGVLSVCFSLVPVVIGKPTSILYPAPSGNIVSLPLAIYALENLRFVHKTEEYCVYSYKICLDVLGKGEPAVTLLQQIDDRKRTALTIAASNRRLQSKWKDVLEDILLYAKKDGTLTQLLQHRDNTSTSALDYILEARDLQLSALVLSYTDSSWPAQQFDTLLQKFLKGTFLTRHHVLIFSRITQLLEERKKRVLSYSDITAMYEDRPLKLYEKIVGEKTAIELAVAANNFTLVKSIVEIHLHARKPPSNPEDLLIAPEQPLREYFTFLASLLTSGLNVRNKDIVEQIYKVVDEDIRHYFPSEWSDVQNSSLGDQLHCVADTFATWVLLIPAGLDPVVNRRMKNSIYNALTPCAEQLAPALNSVSSLTAEQKKDSEKIFEALTTSDINTPSSNDYENDNETDDNPYKVEISNSVRELRRNLNKLLK